MVIAPLVTDLRTANNTLSPKVTDVGLALMNWKTVGFSGAKATTADAHIVLLFQAGLLEWSLTLVNIVDSHEKAPNIGGFKYF